jgi:pyruvate formate lyase activating enzyme
MSTLVTNIQGYSIHDGPGIRTIVFFKGCSLACQWCSNPECISSKLEIGWFKSLCTRCGKCLKACPSGALEGKQGDLPALDRERCSGCGECVSVCCYKALVQYGKAMSVDEVYDIVKRDAMFYEASGGGITASGGEALLQPQFVSDLFIKCRDAGIHTCIETSGQATESSLRQVLRYTDLVLYDLKHLNSQQHHRYTGQPNDLILANARVAAESGVEVLFRMPLIPGINDDLPNIRETAAFLKGLVKSAHRIELMPYHRLGKGKYESLSRSYCLAELPSPEPDRAERVKKAFEDFRITCTISK